MWHDGFGTADTARRWPDAAAGLVVGERGRASHEMLRRVPATLLRRKVDKVHSSRPRVERLQPSRVGLEPLGGLHGGRRQAAGAVEAVLEGYVWRAASASGAADSFEQ